MTPVEIIRDAMNRPLLTEDRDEIILGLFPGLSDDEIESFAATLACPLPHQIRELLRFCSGFEGAAANPVDFTGRSLLFDYEEAFPHGIPIGADGFGNFWLVDVTPESVSWGPIYFACHDAPVILYQGPSVEQFLTELFKAHTPPFKSAIDDVRDDRLFDVWTKNPGVMDFEECAASPDPALRGFATELGPSFQIIDLRQAQIGMGFSWGRYGPSTVVRRFKHFPIFAYRREGKKGFLARILG